MVPIHNLAHRICVNVNYQVDLVLRHASRKQQLVYLTMGQGVKGLLEVKANN